MLTSTIGAIAFFLTWFAILFFDRVEGTVTLYNWTIPVLWSVVACHLKSKGFRPIARVGAFALLLMLFADGVAFKEGLFRIQFAYLTMVIALCFYLKWIYTLCIPRLASLISFVSVLLFFVIPSFYAIHSIDLNAAISRDVFYAILGSNLRESLEFGITYLSLDWVFISITAIVLLLWAVISQGKTEGLKSQRRVATIQLVIISMLFYAQLMNLRMYRYASGCIREYRTEVERFIKTQEQFRTDNIVFDAQKDEAGETYIVVIGESLNKHHMSLYGYPRPTNPLLEMYAKDAGFLIFDQAYSAHTHTIEVLSLSLTEANQHNLLKYYESLSIINILNKANIDTIWITNQSLLGAFDNVVSIVAHQSDQLISLNSWIGGVTTTQHHDEVVLDALDEVLMQESSNNRVIFIHLSGSHWAYNERFTKAFNVFAGNDGLQESNAFKMLDASRKNKVNHYDNSVLYNDYVVSAILDRLSALGGASGFLYFSDHGEDVYGGLEHYSSHFTFEMTQIPLLLWFSEGYRSRYPQKFSSLSKHTDQLFCNDTIYDTLIGIFGVKTDRVNSRRDLSSEAYRLSRDEALTLHGKIKLSEIPSDSNPIKHNK